MIHHSEKDGIETAISQVIKRYGHSSPPDDIDRRWTSVFTDTKISVQRYRDINEHGVGFAAMVVAPTGHNILVYLREPQDESPRVQRPGLWIQYLSRLGLETLNQNERRRNWELAEPHAPDGSDLAPIEDSAIFKIYESKPNHECERCFALYHSRNHAEECCLGTNEA